MAAGNDGYGYRPGRGRLHALAEALRLFNDGRRVLVVADIKDAFEHVPIQRLMDVIRLRLPGARDLWELISRILVNGTKRGIRQGSPLSPLLLNLYLDHSPDRKWRKLLPETPLLRTADDMLVMGRTEPEAIQGYATLHCLLGNAGLQLKESQEDAVHNLCKGNLAEYLGFQLQQHDEDLEFRIAEDTWSALSERLERAHLSSAPPLRAVTIIEGMVDQLGPCYPFEDGDREYARVAGIAGELAYDEIPDCATLMQRWRAAHARWCRLHTHRDAAARTVGGGSACPRVFSAHVIGRGGGARKGAPPPTFSFSEVTLYTDGCCLDDRRGGWAFLLKPPGHSRCYSRSNHLSRTTSRGQRSPSGLFPRDGGLPRNPGRLSR